MLRLDCLPGGPGRFAEDPAVCLVEGVGVGVTDRLGNFLDGQFGAQQQFSCLVHPQLLHISGEGLADAGVHPFLQCGRGNAEMLRDGGDAQLLIGVVLFNVIQDLLFQALRLVYPILGQPLANGFKAPGEILAEQLYKALVIEHGNGNVAEVAVFQLQLQEHVAQRSVGVFGADTVTGGEEGGGAVFQNGACGLAVAGLHIYCDAGIRRFGTDAKSPAIFPYCRGEDGVLLGRVCLCGAVFLRCVFDLQKTFVETAFWNNADRCRFVLWRIKCLQYHAGRRAAKCRFLPGSEYFYNYSVNVVGDSVVPGADDSTECGRLAAGNPGNRAF